MPSQRAKPPPSKVKKINVKPVAELNFDISARQDYLTGYRKRKLQRQSEARDIAKRKEREERITHRKEIREERKQDLEKHLAEVDAILKRQADDFDDEDAEEDEDGKAEEEWQGFEEPSRIDGTDEYVDEDKYTTVTIKEMGDADEWNASEDEDGKVVTKMTDGVERNEDGTEVKKKRVWTKERPKNNKPKKKKPKFKYESKAERQKTRTKQKEKNAKFAKQRRGE